MCQDVKSQCGNVYVCQYFECVNVTTGQSMFPVLCIQLSCVILELILNVFDII